MNIKMENLKSRLKLGGTKKELHDLTFYNPFVKSVSNQFNLNSEFYEITFTDNTKIIYNIK